MPPPVLPCAGGSAQFGTSEITIFQYAMPGGDGYVLQPVATYFLPITGGSGPDVEPGTTLLWMATSGKARHSSRC